MRNLNHYLTPLGILANHSRFVEWSWILAVGGLPFILYLSTIAPTVYGLDSAELTTGAYTLGIVHAPGSPLFLILGHIYTWLPFGDVGYRVNLLSASSAALSLIFVYLFLLRITNRRAISIGTTWFLAFTYFFWISALAAEVYALAACFASALLLLGLLWVQEGRAWQLCAFSFLFALGLGNHPSSGLFGLGLAWIILSNPSLIKRPALLLIAVGFGLLGASIFLYLPLRFLSDTPMNYAKEYWGVNLTEWEGMRWMLTGSMFRNLFWGVPIQQIPGEVLLYFHKVWSNFLGLGLVIALFGLFFPSRHPRVLRVGMVLMQIVYLAFYVPYGAGDKELMFLPSFVIWGIWIGLGADFIQERIDRKSLSSRRVFVPAVLFLLAISAVVFNYAYVDLSQDRSARKIGEDILLTIDPHAVYFGTWLDTPVLEYLQWVEGWRPDVTARNLLFISPEKSHRMAIHYLSGGRPVYTSMPGRFIWGQTDAVYVFRCNCYRIIQNPNGSPERLDFRNHEIQEAK